MKLILFGAPGSGKGTQASVLEQRLGTPAISTGNILRAAIAAKTPVGLRAESYVSVGNLVPDDLIVELVKDRLAQEDCQSGFILDGFPRTIPQGEALEAAGVAVDAVLNIEVSDEVIEQRLTGRRVCACGATYHVSFNPPAKEGVCDTCGGALIRRQDDNPETVRDRLRVFHETTEPLKGWYEKKGKLVTVAAADNVAGTSRKVLEALEL